MSRSNSDRQPPRHRRFDPGDRDDQHRALTRAATQAGVLDVELAVTGHDINIAYAAYLAEDLLDGKEFFESLAGCECPDGLCYHLGPVVGYGWKVTA